MNAAQMMLKYLQEEKFSESEKYFEDAKKSGSDDEQYMIAQLLSQYGYIREALELYNILLQKYPDESELKILIAELLIELEQDEEAYQYLSSIPKSDPHYPAALLIEADLYEIQGLFEVSEMKLLEAKELLPDELVIDYALGELYMSQGRFLEASRRFNYLIDVNMMIDGVSLYERIAEALSAGGAFEEALPYYEKALKEKENIDTLFGYGLTAFQSGNDRKAKLAFQKLRQIDPAYHSLYYYLAQIHEREGDLAEALKVIKSGIELDDFNKDLYVYAGKLSLKHKDEEMAESYLREALVLDPDLIEALLLLNQILLQQERYEDVLEVIELVSKDGGYDPRLHWDAAISYQQTEQYEKAMEAYTLAYEDYKNHPDFLSDYGYFLIEEGIRDVALQIFRSLSKMEPQSEEWLLLVQRLEEE